MTKEQKSRFNEMYVSIAERYDEEGLEAFWQRAVATVPDLEGGVAQDLKGDAVASFLVFVEAEAAQIAGA